jgi:hypothetical protein
MPIAELCPKCGKSLKAPDQLAGKRVKCLQCQTSFTLSAASPVTDEAPAPSEDRPEREQPDEAQAVEGQAATGAIRLAFWLGLASLVLGVSAVLIGFFPSTMGYCRTVAWLGILLGGSAMALAIVREECDFGFPFAGSAASLLSLALIAFWLGVATPGEGPGGPPGGPPGRMGQGPPPNWKSGPPRDRKGGPPGEKGKGNPAPSASLK